MSLSIITGRASALQGAMSAYVAGEIKADKNVIVLVPRQLTLETEIELLSSLSGAGSFRLSVCSTAKFIVRIFDAAGVSTVRRIDEQGRAMAIYSAIRRGSNEIVWYRDAHHFRGFSKRVLKEITALKQAGVNSEALLVCAASQPEGALKRKAIDLAHIMRAYDASLEGRFLDGEDETRRAAECLERAAFLRESRLAVFGFDVIPASLQRLIAAASAVCPETRVYLPMEDIEAYEPMRRSIARLRRTAKAYAAHVSEEVAPAANPGRADIEALASRLLSPGAPYMEAPRHIRLACFKNPYDEALFAASLCRELAITRGFRYRDMLVLAPDMTSRHEAIARAFGMCGVPVFFAEPREAARYPVARVLTCALKAIASYYRGEDVAACLKTGMLPITDDEAGEFANYIISRGLRGGGFKRAQSDARMEDIRLRALSPVFELEAELKGAQSMRDELVALYGFFEAIRALEQCAESQARLTLEGRRREAGESAQAWNRVISCMDQLDELMGGERLGAKELYEIIGQSLASVELKGLPQSGDAVSAEGISRSYTRRAKALIVLGLNDAPAPEANGLFTDGEMRELGERLDEWLGPDALDVQNMRRMYLHTAICSTTDAVFFSYPLSGDDGSPLRPAMLVDELRRAFPLLRVSSDHSGLLRANSVGEAVYRIASCPEAITLASAVRLAPGGAEAIEKFKKSLAWDARSDEITRATAELAYGQISSVSVTRLESFAMCPFRHFIKYALRPQINKPYELSYADEGNFMHAAARAFTSRERELLPGMEPDEAARRMDSIASELLDSMLDGPLGMSPVSRAEKRRLLGTAKRAAWIMAEQLSGGEFAPGELEIDFGRDWGGVELGDGCVLEGRIDRIDHWGEYVRVIDYKRGGRAPSMTEIEAGLQLQLTAYLAVAVKASGGKPAGAYYFPLDEAVVSTLERDKTKIDELRAKKLRLSGIFPADAEIVRAMNKTPERAYKIRINKDGSVSKSGEAKTQAEFDELMKKTIDFCAKYAREIKAGKTDVSPAVLKNKSACDWCEYKAVCMKDKASERAFV